MSFNYDRYNRQQSRRSYRSVGSSSQSFSYIPLLLTITAASVGIAGWIWSQRREEDDDYYYYDSDEEDRSAPKPGSGPRPDLPNQPPSFRAEPRPGETSYVDVQGDSAQAEWRQEDEEEAQGIVARMSGAIRRTPSPQQMFDSTRKSVVAGVAAASAAVGKGLSAITEEDKEASFVDHERWSEEAETQSREGTVVPDAGAAATAALAGTTAAGAAALASQGSRSSQSQQQVRGRRKTVAVVISAEGDYSRDQGNEDSYNIENASILSHLVRQVNHETTNLLVLIYAPYLQKHPLANMTPTDSRPPRDLSNASSYSNISTPAPDPASAEGEVIQQYSSDDSNTLYAALAAQAQSLVSHPTHVMPFTTENGHVHMLRHLSPNVVYIQESLCGNGTVIKDITGWTGQVVIVLGAEGAGGGLVDTETEDEGAATKNDERKFWMDESIVGLGKADVVDGEKIAEDWTKRIGN